VCEGVPDCAVLQKGLALSFASAFELNLKGFSLINESLQVVYFLQTEHLHKERQDFFAQGSYLNNIYECGPHFFS